MSLALFCVIIPGGFGDGGDDGFTVLIVFCGVMNEDGQNEAVAVREFDDADIIDGTGPKAEVSMLFFKTVQNKMHWAVHGNTAAEVIFNRINAGKPHIGFTAFKGTKPTKEDIKIAKNYLNEEEINILNRVVTAYLEVAELQALHRKPMFMKDWIARMDDFLRMTGNDILQNAGSISHEQALLKANQEYLAYKEKTKEDLSRVEQDLAHFIDQTGKAIEQKKKKN